MSSGAIAGWTVARGSPARPPLQLEVPYGEHRFEVRSVDADGVPHPTPIEHVWLADPITPEARIVSGPTSETNANTAEIAFTLDRAGATAECRLDYGAWTPCASPVRYTGLPEGRHRVQVRPSNQGRVGLGAEHRSEVDLTAPDTRIDGGPLVDGSRTTKPRSG